MRRAAHATLADGEIRRAAHATLADGDTRDVVVANYAGLRTPRLLMATHEMLWCVTMVLAWCASAHLQSPRVRSLCFAERDRLDSTREEAPLIQADDALEVITDGMSIDAVIDALVQQFRSRIPEEIWPTPVG